MGFAIHASPTPFHAWKRRFDWRLGYRAEASFHPVPIAKLPSENR